MKYNELLHSIPSPNHGWTGLRLSHSRNDFSNKIKYNDNSSFFPFYYRREKGGKRGTVYIKGERTTLECLAALKNNRLTPPRFDSRASRPFPILPGNQR